MAEPKKFKILCIDGGGIKGLYSAQLLAKFEEVFRTNLSDHFDLICGTSTGGIIALGASLKIPMSKVVEFYEQKGSQIFTQWIKWGGIGKCLLSIWQALFFNKYASAPLRKALEEVFGARTLGESHNLLCISAYNITTGNPRIFKKDYDTLDQDDQKSYVDVALATSAAPTYFPVKEINNMCYVDGGLFANNPILVGLTEYFCKWAHTGIFDGVEILSISSCEKNNGESPKFKHRSFLRWKDTLFDSYSNGQSKCVDFFLQQLKKSGMLNCTLDIVRVVNSPLSGEQEKLVQLDNASRKSMKLLKAIALHTAVNYKEKAEVRKFFEESKTINPNEYGK